MDFLEQHKDAAPSLILHLFDSHFRFGSQEGVFLYNGPMRFFFDALNEGKIPVDLVDVLSDVHCRFYDGCLIVEVHDHRRTQYGGSTAAEAAEAERAVDMDESFWIYSWRVSGTAASWTAEDVLEIERLVLLAVEEPLDLAPDVQVSRISNAIRYIEYGHLVPRKQRKYNSAEVEAEQAAHEEKMRLLTFDGRPEPARLPAELQPCGAAG
ncbi:hypothetical protein DL89DRAFT_220553 [Linderina pennispora]|uniref:Spt20-like SEP domain-containing protein n=1 Tax=Linderina pennispora TaxID=61395 RepID=A0A1Y1WH66_9FUNG|nr:uncharacterized protein DL89DRAFT_220553 [Linderina pennispora]ORX72725.1 hypothetical protein DL89DRAFT_220553 [Linderina pennispora]